MGYCGRVCGANTLALSRSTRDDTLWYTWTFGAFYCLMLSWTTTDCAVRVNSHDITSPTEMVDYKSCSQSPSHIPPPIHVVPESLRTKSLDKIWEGGEEMRSRGLVCFARRSDLSKVEV